MKFLADENFPLFALRLLRTLLTFDKDFGELAFHRGLPATCGVILFRTHSLSPLDSANLALSTLQSGITWAGHFCVVNRNKLRLTPLRTPPA
jgi:predicted nuclease of predicted toxin-antitoxin system